MFPLPIPGTCFRILYRGLRDLPHKKVLFIFPTSVSELDPDWVRFQLGQRIRIDNTDPNPGRPKFVPQYRKRKSCFKSHNDFCRGLKKRTTKLSNFNFFENFDIKTFVSIRIRIRHELDPDSLNPDSKHLVATQVYHLV
jgi:hypothetical protein